MRVKVLLPAPKKFAPVAQVEERLTCNQQNGFSSNPGCSNCGRADYRNVGYDCDSCLLWVQLPPATPIAGVKIPGTVSGRRTTRGGRLLCKQDSQVGSIPTRSTKFRQSRMRGRYAPLKTERAAFNSLGWRQSGNGVKRLHPCLGSTWTQFNSEFPDQSFASVPERIDGLRYERRERGFESCRALQNRATVDSQKESTQCLGPSNAT